MSSRRNALQLVHGHVYETETEAPASHCCYAAVMVTPFHLTTQSLASSHQAFKPWRYLPQPNFVLIANVYLPATHFHQSRQGHSVHAAKSAAPLPQDHAVCSKCSCLI